MIKKLSTTSSRETPSLPPHHRYITSDSQGKHSNSGANNSRQLRDLKTERAKNEHLAKQIAVLKATNVKLVESLKTLNEQNERNKQYIMRLETRLVDRVGESDGQLVVSEYQSKLKLKDIQILDLKSKLSDLSLVSQQNQTLRKFLDKSGQNLSKQLLMLQHCKSDLERRVRQLQVELQISRQEPSEDYIRSQHDLKELKFYLDQKDQYCARLVKQNKQLRELKDQARHRRDNINAKLLKKDISDIIRGSFPGLVD